jgi:hypothetical protein
MENQCISYEEHRQIQINKILENMHFVGDLFIQCQEQEWEHFKRAIDKARLAEKSMNNARVVISKLFK